MAFAIIADFPLGTYRAHRPDGQVDALPSPARLHAALLSAAAQGVRATADRDVLQPAAVDRKALGWLEETPPDAIHVPSSMMFGGESLAYRPEGFFGVRAGRRILETREDRLGAIALAGSVAWIWDDDPPPDVTTAIDALCRDVSHLGTADSPVLLRSGDAAATHRLDVNASIFAGSGIETELPTPGRTDALERAYVASVGRAPTAAADGVKTNESAAVSPRQSAATIPARYVTIAPAPTSAPWSTVVLLPTIADIPPDRRVQSCVALHRALVARIGDGAPSLVTGRYDPGVARPANRLAIHYISSRIPAAPRVDGPGAFALLLPADADAADLAEVERALRGLTEVRITARRALRVKDEPVTLDGGTFWAPVAGGKARVWVTTPAAIPDSRPIRGVAWTIGNAAMLSVGLVLRDRFPRRARRAEWYGLLVDEVRSLGVRVLEAHKLNSPEGWRYVHHIGPEAAVQPYRAALDLGTALGDRTIIAIGQSRHLGGGLLTPLDVDQAALVAPAPSDADR